MNRNYKCPNDLWRRIAWTDVSPTMAVSTVYLGEGYNYYETALVGGTATLIQDSTPVGASDEDAQRMHDVIVGRVRDALQKCEDRSQRDVAFSKH